MISAAKVTIKYIPPNIFYNIFQKNCKIVCKTGLFGEQEKVKRGIISEKIEPAGLCIERTFRLVSTGSQARVCYILQNRLLFVAVFQRLGNLCFQFLGQFGIIHDDLLGCIPSLCQPRIVIAEPRAALLDNTQFST